MNRLITAILTGLITLISLSPAAFSADKAVDFNKFPSKGIVTMIDLGAKKCIPCKMMAPVLKKLEKVYRGKAEIVFIDVGKNRDQAPRFRVRAIPTQIFFNREGKEVYRHIGYMDENSIVGQLAKMGVPAPSHVRSSIKGGM